LEHPEVDFNHTYFISQVKPNICQILSAAAFLLKADKGKTGGKINTSKQKYIVY